MIKKDIEAMFTAKLREYMDNGWIVHMNTMGGMQTNEVMKMDMSKDGRIVRILLQTERDNGTDYMLLTVGENTKPLSGNIFDIIWNSELKVLEERKFVMVTKEYFVEPDSAEFSEIRRKQRERRRIRNRYGDDYHDYQFPDKAKAIVLPFMRRQRRCKSLKVNDIERVVKAEYMGKVRYLVFAKGNSYRIR